MHKIFNQSVCVPTVLVLVGLAVVVVGEVVLHLLVMDAATDWSRWWITCSQAVCIIYVTTISSCMAKVVNWPCAPLAWRFVGQLQISKSERMICTRVFWACKANFLQVLSFYLARFSVLDVQFLHLGPVFWRRAAAVNSNLRRCSIVTTGAQWARAGRHGRPRRYSKQCAPTDNLATARACAVNITDSDR